ncbi:hypothetical protein K7X08_032380 [Anisodus acutangulus]|uniref:Uncharacterized protein n=1 Tax=Anisodus acutangulus TaxID=402998 RepID=A0A9Q1LWY1_9SOLA|nr:hypothetical protein K7X08_032380 [Anisodus acutangulus]
MIKKENSDWREAKRKEFSQVSREDFPNVSAYCKRLKELADQLCNVGAPVTNNRLVLQMVDGLSEAYNGVGTLLRQSNLLPPFYQVRSMLTLEEVGLAKKAATGASSVEMMTSSDNSNGFVDNSGQNWNGGGKKGQNRRNNGKNRSGNNGNGRNSGTIGGNSNNNGGEPHGSGPNRPGLYLGLPGSGPGPVAQSRLLPSPLFSRALGLGPNSPLMHWAPDQLRQILRPQCIRLD